MPYDSDARVELKGLTWDHSRGFDPMATTAAEYARRHSGISISWDRRSLQAFADSPIGEMADRYDIIVIDHPHVGEVARSGLLMPFDGRGCDTLLATLADQSVGGSHCSYEYDGHQWALAIDAAAPVAAFRPDRLAQAPTVWDDVVSLARTGTVGFAMIPINALMTFFGMARNKGYAIAAGDRLINDYQAQEILEFMCEIVSLMSSRCLQLDPIGIYEWMGREADGPAYSAFGYGYTNYSRAGYCPFPLEFADAPGFGDNGPRGTVLGGTGIAVSAQSAHQDIACDYALWVAGAECQRGLFFASGGQPGNALAWEDEACNARCRNFLKNTRRTLETAWLRPRYDGYMGLQDKAGDIVHACMRGDRTIPQTVAGLQSAYQESLR